MGAEDGPLHAGLSCWPQRHFDYEALCSPRRRDHQSRNGESRLRAVESPQYSPRVFEGEMTAVTTVAAIIEARELWKSGREDLNLRPPGPESDFGTY